MQITRMTWTKYYLLSLLGALMVAVGVLAVAPSAQAQTEEPTIDKECTPNPVQIGEQITCTIDLVAAPGTVAFVQQFTDTFPAGVRPTDVTAQQIVNNGEPTLIPGLCTVSSQTVECGPFPSPIVNFPEVFTIAFEVTVDAIAEQCGTFPNTAMSSGVFVVGDSGQPITFSEDDTEEITVEGCEVPPAPEPGQQQPNQQQGAPAPITQEFEQDSEAGEIDQSFEVS